MKLKQTLKSMALAGMTFAAGLGTYLFAQSKGENTSDNTKAKTYVRLTISHQHKEFYEVRSDVLMPQKGESQSDYELRRTRLEKQNQLLHKKMAENARQRWEKLKREGASPRLISAAAKRYADHLEGSKEIYYSYYTEIGQGKLKYGNAYKGDGKIGGQHIQNSPTAAASVRQGRTYDF